MNRALLFLLALVTLVACSAAGDPEPAAGFDALTAPSSTGPKVASGGPSEVWAAENAWADRTTTAARAAGMAWPADSGLSWEEKYRRWVGSLETMDRPGGGTTFVLSTPFQGRTLPAPTLECAEVALMLRATFASWYKLPFFLNGWDAEAKKVVYAGHFGFVDGEGKPWSKFPSFASKYDDFTKAYQPGMAWPSDPKLRKQRLGSDDRVPFLDAPGLEAGAGAYFDEIFLNKRAGYFMRLLLLYFGSVNLADGSNMFPLVPESIGPGDALVHRWQKNGIGHVMPIVRVAAPLQGKLAAEIASGSMPRRQPLWKEPLDARSYFTSERAGGPGEAMDGNPYAKLGGGVRRWRSAVARQGRWHNDVLEASARVDDADLAAIAARPARFEEILVSGTPEERRETALAKIEEARAHLRAHPASCSARTNREAGFAELYQVSAQHFGQDRAAVDAERRKLEDFVFGELQYDASKTCCWNTTTAAMAEIVLDLAGKEQDEAQANQVCAAPTVLRAHGAGDGYSLWQEHAAALGRAADWRAWTADEACPQAGVAEDTVKTEGLTGWCALHPAEPPPESGSGSGGGGGGDDPCGGVTWEGECDGETLKYCSSGELVVTDCAAQGQTCGWDGVNEYFDCE